MTYSAVPVGDKIRYTDEVEQITFEIPKGDFAGLIFGKPMASLPDPFAATRAAMDAPMGTKRLTDIAKERHAKTASVIVSDGTRGVPTHLASDYICDELVAAGIKPEDILFIVAVGLHRPATEEEYKALVSDKYYGKVKMISSTPYDEESSVCIGNSSRRTPIEVNRQALECDLHIAVGRTQLHAMAGWSGGRKSVLPGICSYKTIYANHTAQMILDPMTIRGKLLGNPMAIEMQEAADLYRVDYGVTFVVNDKNETSAVFAGDLKTSHLASIDYMSAYLEVKLDEKPDIFVITPGAPFNQNFYQASRPMRHLNSVIGPETVVAFYAGCPEGVQSEDMQRPFRNAHTVEEAEKWMFDNWDVQMDDTLLFLKSLRTGAKFLCYSPGVDRKVFESMLCLGADSYEDFMKRAYELSGKEHPRVMFYPMCQNYFTSLK